MRLLVLYVSDEGCKEGGGEVYFGERGRLLECGVCEGKGGLFGEVVFEVAGVV